MPFIMAKKPHSLVELQGGQCAAGITTSDRFLGICRQMLHLQLLIKSTITHPAPEEVSPLF